MSYSSRLPVLPQEFPNADFDTWLPHQLLTHQHRVDASVFEILDIISAGDAAFADQRAIFGQLFPHADRVLQVDFKGPQVAIVNSNQHRSGFDHALGVFRFVEFDQGSHSQFDGAIVQAAQTTVVEAFGNQQHSVRAGNSRFNQLVLVNQKVLPQQRQANLLADRGEKREAALKERLIGQHADACCSRLLVDLGNFHRIEVGADDALGRAGFLHLGDQFDGTTGSEWCEEVADWRSRVEPRFQLGYRSRPLGNRDLFLFLGNNLVEDGGHDSASCKRGGGRRIEC